MMINSQVKNISYLYRSISSFSIKCLGGAAAVPEHHQGRKKISFKKIKSIKSSSNSNELAQYSSSSPRLEQNFSKAKLQFSNAKVQGSYKLNADYASDSKENFVPASKNVEDYLMNRGRHKKDFKYQDGPPNESEEEQNARLSKHFYKTIYPWNSKEELANYLLNNIIYQDNGIIAFNKPYGVGVRNALMRQEYLAEKEERQGKDKDFSSKKTFADSLYHTRGTGSSDFTLEDTLDILKEKLNLPELSIVKSTEKFSSGVCIFSENSKSSARISKSLHNNKGLKIKTYGFYIISTNIPRRLSMVGDIDEKVGLALRENPETKISHPIIETNLTKNSIKKGRSSPIRVKLSLIDKNLPLNVSLTSINTSSIKHNFLRVYYASIVSPILGDHLYSSRVATIGGYMSLVPEGLSNVGSSHQKLSHDLITALKLSKSTDSLIVPLQSHCHSFTLSNYIGKEKHLEIIAPVSQMLNWTCNKLNLDISQNKK